ncbi:hypothetical protein G9A89_002489 [Geosiphon pyriformis]|nr:hypothetical protein G9A89_002489 [Geosiphon pyriformis]
MGGYTLFADALVDQGAFSLNANLVTEIFTLRYIKQLYEQINYVNWNLDRFVSRVVSSVLTSVDWDRTLKCLYCTCSHVRDEGSIRKKDPAIRCLKCGEVECSDHDLRRLRDTKEGFTSADSSLAYEQLAKGIGLALPRRQGCGIENCVIGFICSKETPSDIEEQGLIQEVDSDRFKDKSSYDASHAFGLHKWAAGAKIRCKLGNLEV